MNGNVRRDATGRRNGGGRGIRTPGALSSSTVFKTVGLNRSPIPPHGGLCEQVHRSTMNPPLLISTPSLTPGSHGCRELWLQHAVNKPQSIERSDGQLRYTSPGCPIQPRGARNCPACTQAALTISLSSQNPLFDENLRSPFHAESTFASLFTNGHPLPLDDHPCFSDQYRRHDDRLRTVCRT